MREKIWACTACGKWVVDRYDFLDPACFINSIQCFKDKVRFKKNGRVSRVLKNGIVQKEV